MQAYTDGNKHEQGVGSGAAIFIEKEIVTQIRLKLNGRCSNNQAEQPAIIKALETIESLHNKPINPRTAVIFTDSMVGLDSLRNVNKHVYLFEDFGMRVSSLERYEWKITFSWVKAHVGIYGNERAYRLIKEAARSNGTRIAFNRFPRSTLYYEAAEQVKQQWRKCDKAATTKQYFPTIQDRLEIKFNQTPNLAAMLTGHARKRAYLHGFKLLDDATCICGQGDQTTDYLLNHCAAIYTMRSFKTKHT